MTATGFRTSVQADTGERVKVATGTEVIEKALFKGAGRLFWYRAVDLQVLNGPSALASQARTNAARLIGLDDMAQVGMMQRAMQRQAHIEVCIVIVPCLIGVEGDNDVCMVTLGADIGGGVCFAFVQFSQHLLLAVAALGRITPHFPASAQIFRWSKIDPHAISVAHLLPVEAK